MADVESWGLEGQAWGNVRRVEIGLGKGVYTPAEAARLVGLHPSRVRRWVAGYEFTSSGTRRRSSPLFDRDLPVIDGRIALGFLDLVEVLFVRSFLDHGVTMRTIRFAAIDAAVEFHTTHPFSVKRFRTDGEHIFARFKDEGGVIRLMQLGRGRQFVFRKVVEPLLLQLEHDETTKQTNRWWPLGKRRHVVLDPERSFGQPIIAGVGVPTDVLYAAHRSGESEKAIADWYGVTERDVRDAIAFEGPRHDAARAA